MFDPFYEPQPKNESVLNLDIEWNDLDTALIYGQCCGQRMFLGKVLEFNNENPLLQLEKPLGFNAIRQILHLIDCKKTEFYYNS